LMSGIFFSGPPSEILKAWREDRVQFILSPEIVDEYTKVAKILADDYPGIDTSSILTLILTNSEVVRVLPLPRQVCEDADDDKFLACALAGKCSMIIDDLSEEAKLLLGTKCNEIDSLLSVIIARQSKRLTARVNIFK
jgi:uncharacterized protein